MRFLDFATKSEPPNPPANAAAPAAAAPAPPDATTPRLARRAALTGRPSRFGATIDNPDRALR